MRVSAISMNYYRAYYNQKINSRGNDNTEISKTNSSNPSQKNNDNKEKIFESINEWKNFCHSQIEQGKLDIIA